MTQQSVSFGACPDVLAGRVRAAQLLAILRHTPLMMTANLFNGVITAWAVAPFASYLLLGLWILALLAYVAVAVRSWLVWQARAAGNPLLAISERTLRRVQVHASLLALMWGIVPVLWFPGIDAYGQVLVATLFTGMMCAGGFALATVPRAAGSYAVILGLGGAGGILLSDNPYALPLSGLLAAYVVTIVRSAAGTARLFVARFTTEAELNERGEDIALLLNAFEESGSDWLFELDADYDIVKCSARFGEVAGGDPARLIGTSFPDRLTDAARAAFLAAVLSGRPFRDLVVEVLPGDRYWSLTANPLDAMPSAAGNPMPGATIRGWRGVGSDVTQKKKAQDELVWLSRTDPLTRLKNRTAFRDISGHLLATARRHKGTFALACLDLDGFKSVNDSLGHPVGDQLLVTVAERLRSFTRDGQRIGRLGGDEFGIAMLDLSREEAVETLSTIIARLSEPYQIDTARITIGASAGLAFAEAEDDVDPLIRNADLALYHAKAGGRGRVAVFDPAMHREANDKRELLEDLREAIASDALELFYQPIVALGTGEIMAFEALVRWRHPRLGLLAPGAFIGLAESSGLIQPLGDWVIARACADAAAWDKPVGVAVNLSPAQFGGSDLAGTIGAALARSGLAAGQLEVEITEAMFLQHDVQVEEFIDRMAAMGVSVALDDFGTGYSSLGYLARFPVQKIKIDRAFVSGEAEAARRSAIVRSIVAIAHALDMTTVAEGVETREDLAWVRELGCSHAQGYLLSRPVPLAQVPALLRQGCVPAPVAA